MVIILKIEQWIGAFPLGPLTKIFIFSIILLMKYKLWYLVIYGYTMLDVYYLLFTVVSTK